MPKIILKRGNGFDNTAYRLRDDIKAMQRLLARAGFTIKADGKYGDKTEEAVKGFQRNNGLEITGTIDQATRDRIDQLGLVMSDGVTLDKFHGDLKWIHDREGHAGMPYWPGGISGVTFDPGVDLGHADSDFIERNFREHLNNDQLEAARRVYGITGEDAHQALSENQSLQSIRISRELAERIFPKLASPYWEDISKRFIILKEDDTPGVVQTVLLSLAYNRGPKNPGLEILKVPLENKDWLEVGKQIGNMQQDHPQSGISKRRRLEAELISNELAYA